MMLALGGFVVGFLGFACLEASGDYAREPVKQRNEWLSCLYHLIAVYVGFGLLVLTFFFALRVLK